MAGLPGREELARLPLRALAAFAARCARRVESHSRERDRALAAEAIRVAERFAAGEDLAAADAAHAASRAGSSAYEVYAEGQHLADAEVGGQQAFRASAATTSAAQAANAVAAAMSGPGESYGAAVAAAASAAARTANHVDPRVAEAAAEDFRALLGLALGAHPESGSPVDPGEGGPLGPYWKAGVQG